MTVLLSTLILGLLGAQTGPTLAGQELIQGRLIGGRADADQPAHFHFQAEQGQRLEIHAHASDVDVKWTLVPPSGEARKRVDEQGAGVPEVLSLVTTETGLYELIAETNDGSANLAVHLAIVGKDPEDPHQRIQQVLDAYPENGPVVGYFFLRSESDLHAEFRGSLVPGEVIRVTTETVLHAFGLRPLLATAAALSLIESGHLDPDHPICELAPCLQRLPKELLLRHVLDGTSGLREIDELHRARTPSTAPDPTRAEAINLLSRQYELNFPPGSGRDSRNYPTRALVLEEIAAATLGVEFEAALQMRAWQPLGMTDAQFHDRTPENALIDWEWTAHGWKPIAPKRGGPTFWISIRDWGSLAAKLTTPKEDEPDWMNSLRKVALSSRLGVVKYDRQQEGWLYTADCYRTPARRFSDPFSTVWNFQRPWLVGLPPAPLVGLGGGSGSRSANAPAPKGLQASLVGNYYSSELDFGFKILPSENGLRLIWGDVTTATLVWHSDRNEFEVRGETWNLGRLHVIEATDSQVSTVGLDGTGFKQLRFERLVDDAVSD